MNAVKHPAPFSRIILENLVELADNYLLPGALVLDPFAGIGRIHMINEDRPDECRFEIMCVEIEQEWAEECAELGPTWCGDFLAFDFDSVPGVGLFDAVITSPTYGNRMADHHEAKDGSRRRSYRHCLGRQLSANSSGKMQWGDEYKAFHWLAWKRVHRVLKDDGVFMLNISDHIRKFQVVEVVEWHREVVQRIGFTMEEARAVKTPRMRDGENRDLRVEEEWILVFRKKSTGKRG